MITEQQAREFLINLINAKTYEQVDFNERSLLLYFRQQEKVEELLGLYQNLWALPYGDIGVVELLRQIEQLEKELRELK